MSPLQRLWPALEALPGLAAVRAEWQTLAGAELVHLEPFLHPQQHLATSYPRPVELGAGLPLRVVEHGSDDFVGVCDETGDTMPLRRADVIVHAIERRTLAATWATALKLTPSGLDAQRTVGPKVIGQTEPATGPRQSVIVVFSVNAEELTATATKLIAEHTDPLVLLTPTRRFWLSSTETLVRNNGCRVFTLQELLLMDSDSRWIGNPRLLNELHNPDGTVEQLVPLSERAQLVLIAMLELNALDVDSRRTTEDIAFKALGDGADPNSLKTVMSDLRTGDLIQSKTGRGGGCWLTNQGQRRAAKLDRL